MLKNFFTECCSIIMDKDIHSKCKNTQILYQEILSNSSAYTFDRTAVLSIQLPGRPAKPDLVSPFEVPNRKPSTKEGHASLIHALAHIEFNAINLALDACYRFQDMPLEYYQNWLQVAAEEVYHFKLLNEHMQTIGFSYGDFVAHNGLWLMSVKTEHDFIARMALIPRTLEARGIDAVPEMQKKLQIINDERGVEILEIIKQDEIKHVTFGDKWFKYACDQQGLNTEQYFFELLEKYDAPKIRGPFNRIDRKKAGFTEFELDRLQQKDSS